MGKIFTIFKKANVVIGKISISEKCVHPFKTPRSGFLPVEILSIINELEALQETLLMCRKIAMHE